MPQFHLTHNSILLRKIYVWICVCYLRHSCSYSTALYNAQKTQGLRRKPIIVLLAGIPIYRGASLSCPLLTSLFLLLPTPWSCAGVELHLLQGIFYYAFRLLLEILCHLRLVVQPSPKRGANQPQFNGFSPPGNTLFSSLNSRFSKNYLSFPRYFYFTTSCSFPYLCYVEQILHLLYGNSL